MRNLIFNSLLTLYLCLNGQLWATNKPINYWPSERKVNVEQAIDLQTSCPTTFIFDSGFEDSEQITQALINEGKKCQAH